VEFGAWRSRRWRRAPLAVALGAAAASAHAAAPGANLDLPAQSLSITLNQVARTGAAELIFDRAVTDGRRAPRLSGRFTTQQALAAALAGSGLTYRRTIDGAFVVSQAGPGPSAEQLAVDPGDGAVSELLVLGRRNLNTGIRRSRDDIQPYDVADSETLARSGAETLEDFMRARMPANAQAAANIQAPSANLASTRSQIDLLGLGGNQTLVLVDGRRLPSLPDGQGVLARFVQPDLNGLPLAAIDRVEVLTATAGAIYGPGATGGVVNVILKRDYNDQSVGLSQGLSARGDAPQTRFGGHLGVSSADGRSSLSLTLGLSRAEGLRFGDRDYVERGRTLRLGQGVQSVLDIPVGSDVNVYGFGAPLVLDAARGGQALGSTKTHFSAQGFTTAEVLANAGTLDLGLSGDAFGRRQSLLTDTQTASFILSGRHQFGAVEAFFDYLHVDDQGRAIAPAGEAMIGPIAGSSDNNPFEQTVVVVFPLGWEGPVLNRTLTRRGTAGLIARLSAGWMASADYSLSLSTLRLEDDRRQPNIYAGIVAALDMPLLYGTPAISPFWSGADFLKAYGSYRQPGGYLIKQQDRLQDFNLRASGPLLRLPGGPLTMTVLAEARTERAPLGARLGYSYLPDAFAHTLTPGLEQTNGSLYAEWRAPLVSAQAKGPWRGLEAQLSVRTDRYRLRVPQYLDEAIAELGVGVLKASDTVIATTLGFRSFLRPDLMLRASYADGFLPPTAEQINYRVINWSGRYFWAQDPKRGGADLGVDGNFDLIAGGSERLKAEKARTLAAGLVFTPQATPGLRLSIDYLRTDKSREVTTYASNDPGYFVAREALYPDRITRLPLTDADRALGYTGGVITKVDASALNVGRSVIESVDVSLDYRHELGGDAALRIYLRYTWQPSYRRRDDPAGAWYETAGYRDGPLAHRGNLGVEWTKGDLTLELNGQYYGRSKVARSGFAHLDSADLIAKQQSDTLPAQVYTDAMVNYVFGADGRTRLQLAVRDLLDARAPIDANSELGYSTYGDPRGRRFELTLARRF